MEKTMTSWNVEQVNLEGGVDADKNKCDNMGAE